MDKCPKCGNKLSRSDILCTRCGALVENLQHRFGAQLPAEPPKPIVPEPPAATPEPPAVMPAQEAPSSAPEAATNESFTSYSAPIIPPVPLKDSATQQDNKKYLELSEVEEPKEAAEPSVVPASEPLVEPVATVEEPQPEAQQHYRTNHDDEDYILHKPEKRPVLLTAFFWVLLGLALFVGFFILNRHVMSAYGSYPAFVYKITDGKINLDTGASVESSIAISVSKAQTEEGEPAHRFDVSAIGGTSVRLLPLGNVYDMEGGSLSIVVPDEALATALSVVSFDDTYMIDNVSMIITAFSQDYTHSLEPLELSLLDAVYERSAPGQDYENTYNQDVTISLTVAQGTSVYVNNDNYTEKINETGQLSLSMPLNPGENHFIVDVVQPGRKSIRESFTVVRELREIALQPGTEFLQVFESAFECGGTTEPGAKVTATIGEAVFEATAKDNGKFTIECELEEYGLHEIALLATAEGMTDGKSVIEAERLPEQNAFMKQAKKTEPADLISNFESLAGKAIQVTGRIEVPYTNAHTTTFVLISGIDRLECRYHGNKKLEAGKSYKLYGMPLAEGDIFYVMFVG